MAKELENTTATTSPASRSAEITLHPGDHVAVIGNLRLNSSSPSAKEGLEAFCDELQSWQGKGHVVINGNLLDTSRSESEDLKTAFEGLDRLRELLSSLGENRQSRVVVIPGLLDARLSWDENLAQQLISLLNCEIAEELRISFTLPSGARQLKVLSGREYDPFARIDHPRSPLETPWRQHLHEELLPRLIHFPDATLYGIDRLENPEDISDFISSRLLYRRAFKWLWLLAIPLVAAFAAKLPLVLSIPFLSRLRHPGAHLSTILELVAISTTIDAVVILGFLIYFTRRAYDALTFSFKENFSAQSDPNRAGRAEAEHLILQGGLGLVVSHGQRAELTQLSGGVFLNPGAACSVMRKTQMRLGLPPYFYEYQVTTWIELEAGATLHARLVSHVSPAKLSWLVRLFAREMEKSREGIAILASYPVGSAWPPPQTSELSSILRPRRIAFFFLFTLGIVNLLSAFTPPLKSRLHLLLELFPIGVPTYANALTALTGIILVALAKGIRLGQRRAWSLAMATLAISIIANLIKGGDVEEASALAIVELYLFFAKGSFTVKSIPTSGFRHLSRALWLSVIVWISGIVATESFQLIRHERLLSPLLVSRVVVEEMMGISVLNPIYLHNRFLFFALSVSGISIAGYAAIAFFRPIVTTVRQELLDARLGENLQPEELVERYSSGTLDYFALRSDKIKWISNLSLISYAIYGSTCIVSPDPIGPGRAGESAFTEFFANMKREGHSVAVLGASEHWLPLYHSLGMHSYYIGDEAIVDVRTLTLEGKAHKGLRQAVNRMTRFGYKVEFFDPSKVNEELQIEVLAVLTASRHGDAERGFSMTLGRIFDPSDKGILLSVCFDPNGVVVGFCQWVPSPGIKGYSLDLMRRDLGDHPNGLIDLIIVQTVEHLKSNGYHAISLNFAAMRATLAGERGDTITRKMERWILKRLSETMQIESLWRFNAKYDPTWLPRYLVYDNPEDLLMVALSIAKAESLWELPLLGRLLSSTTENAKRSPSEVLVDEDSSLEKAVDPPQ